MVVSFLGYYGIDIIFKALKVPFKKEPNSFIGATHSFSDGAYNASVNLKIDNKDLKLIRNLIRRGDDHSKVMRFGGVYLFVKATRAFWQEMDTYKIGVNMYSESTMHTLLKDVRATETDCNRVALLFDDRTDIDIIRLFCLKANEILNKDISDEEKLNMIKLILPEGFLQGRYMQISFQTLNRIVRQRTGHRFKEWSQFIDYVNNLPIYKLFYHE